MCKERPRDAWIQISSERERVGRGRGSLGGSNVRLGKTLEEMAG